MMLSASVSKTACWSRKFNSEAHDVAYFCRHYNIDCVHLKNGLHCTLGPSIILSVGWHSDERWSELITCLYRVG